MRINWKAHLILAAIAVASLVVLLFAPFAELTRVMVAAPIWWSALCGVAWQIVRDELNHDRVVRLQEAQQGFVIGATSHMAIVAFDKHVSFSEEYISEVHNTLNSLFKEGPTKRALDHATKLYNIRRNYFAWLTPKIDAELDKFEGALRRLGAKAGYAGTANASAPNHSEVIKTMYRDFADLLGKEFMGNGVWDGQKLSEDKAIPSVISRFRVILGTEALTELRSTLVANADKMLNAQRRQQH